jgi:Ni/Co efflux regulator RcnB
MRKLILASALTATLIPAGAMAQSYGKIRHDQREINHDRRQVQATRAYGERHDVRDARRELHGDRQERREDWRDFRRAHLPHRRRCRSARRRRYHPVAIGYRFDPVFYGQRYWIDPVRYHLRPVCADMRWVRYGNDVLLVNVRTGRVIEVNNGFFY